MEQIGKITIDDTFYPGEDQYCDGPVEDELLQIVTQMDASEYDDAIEEKLSWPVLYHLSHLRENIVRFIPTNKNAKVLEIGSGCGAITGALSEKFGQVQCVELSKKRSLINASRHQECTNVSITLGNFEEVEPSLSQDFDYIFLIGVFEYARGYIHTEHPFEDFLTIIKKHLAPKGRIVIAIENQYGLKYFAGCKEDHAGRYYEGVAGYPGDGVAKTFGRKGLMQIFKACGFSEDAMHFYYPYPDYKFPTVIYSDAYLPKVGELTNNMRNFDADRLLTFDEKLAFDSIIRQGYFPDFSNSFLVILGEGIEVQYTKFSNDRRKKYRIRTSICDLDGRVVIKYPENEYAQEHIAALEDHYKALSEKYAGSGVSVNSCRLLGAAGGEAACLEYLEGTSLEELLDERLHAGDVAGFEALLERFDALSAYNEKAPVSDYDLIYANIMVSPEGEWTIIDYEWTFALKREAAETRTRAILIYMTGPENRRRFLFEHGIAQRYGITEENLGEFALLEKEFQHEVTGSRRSMYELYDLMKKPCIPYLKAYAKWEEFKKPSPHVYQIYLDRGNGFSEEKSDRYTDAFEKEGRIERMTYFPLDVKALRIDPLMEKCILQEVTVLVNGKDVPLSKWKHNGIVAPSGALMFRDEDPHMEISMRDLKKVAGVKLEDKNELTFMAKVHYVDAALSEALFGKETLQK